MSDILIQFHALPEELRTFAQQVVGEFDLHVTAMKFFPYAAVKIDRQHLEDIFSRDSDYREIAFTTVFPSLPATGRLNFLDDNPSSLCIGVERINEKGLRQSSLSARTNDPSTLVVWKRIATRFKRTTKAGAMVVNPETGASIYTKLFRYSAGAKAKAEEGVLMLPIAGANRIEFQG